MKKTGLLLLLLVFFLVTARITAFTPDRVSYEPEFLAGLTAETKIIIRGDVIGAPDERNGVLPYFIRGSVDSIAMSFMESAGLMVVCYFIVTTYILMRKKRKAEATPYMKGL